MSVILYYEYPDGERIGTKVGPGAVFSLCEGVRWILGVIAVDPEANTSGRGIWYCEAGR
jgi:hypothetical protein